MRIDETKLTAYLDGELPEGERQWVEKRLADSPQLRRRLDQLRRETEQVNQALDSLAPEEVVVSASLALKRFRSHLSLPDQHASSPSRTSHDPSLVVWESPSLWAEIKVGLKNTLVNRSKLPLVAGLVLMIPVITVALVLLFNSYGGELSFGPIRLGGSLLGYETETPPNAAASASSSYRGIQADPLGDTQANIEHVKTLGFEWVKFQMPWRSVETSQGHYDWGQWDEVIDAYAENDIKVLLSIVKAPDWARPADDDKSVEGLPADPSSYAEFVARVADRYRDQVQAIEIWDEQNLWYKAGGKGRVDAAEYVELLRDAYGAIKAVNQDMLVISGAMTPAGNVPDMAVDDVEYLQQMYAGGAKDYFDALGAHAPGYNCPAMADWQTFENDTASFQYPFESRHHSWCFLGPLEAYREVMVANGDQDKAAWVTEFGWAVAASPDSGYGYAADNTRAEQAQWILEAYQWAEDQTWVGPLFLFNLDYGLTAPDTQLAYFSILDTPAYNALAGIDQATDRATEEPSRSPETPSMSNKLDADFNRQVRLLGYDLDLSQVEAEGTIHLTLYWQAQQPIETAYTVFVHLLDESGQLVTQMDQEPQAGAAPMTGWLPGQVVVDEILVPVTEAVASIQSIAIGLYHPLTGERLPVLDQDGSVLDHSVMIPIP